MPIKSFSYQTLFFRLSHTFHNRLQAIVARSVPLRSSRFFLFCACPVSFLNFLPNSELEWAALLSDVGRAVGFGDITGVDFYIT